MNPNLKIFFKRSFYVVVFAAFIAAVYYTVTRYIDIDFSSIGSYLANGFLGFMMILMVGVIGGLILRSVWAGVMNRADSIEVCFPDKKHDGVHIIASHYSPGGESSEGYSSYFHYYLDQHGKLYLSKKVENNGNKIEHSTQHLSAQTKLQLAPDEDRGLRIGSHTDGNDNATIATMSLRRGALHFRGYERWIDYGFKITYNVGDQTKWRVTI